MISTPLQRAKIDFGSDIFDFGVYEELSIELLRKSTFRVSLLFLHKDMYVVNDIAVGGFFELLVGKSKANISAGNRWGLHVVSEEEF
jgi:hypothetical protein